MADPHRPVSGVRAAFRARPLVLHAEDETDTHVLYATVLRDNGFDVVRARDGYEAVHYALELRPDVIVMDVGLPVVDGLEATRRLKAAERTSSIPVVILSGFDLSDDERAGLAQRAAAVLVKPAAAGDLVRTLKEVLGRPRELATKEKSSA
jgi:CheY-like chemotaxis protein